MTSEKTYTKLKSPVGELTLVASSSHLIAVLWENDDPKRTKINFHYLRKNSSRSIFIETEKQLEEYFSGKRRSFDLPLMPEGTPFQKSVWHALSKIPFGVTVSYSEIAKLIRSPRACRAVGAANGRNPISIILPCHRVIGKSGELTGFAGGLQIKRRLLELEQRHS